MAQHQISETSPHNIVIHFTDRCEIRNPKTLKTILMRAAYSSLPFSSSPSSSSSSSPSSSFSSSPSSSFSSSLSSSSVSSVPFPYKRKIIIMVIIINWNHSHSTFQYNCEWRIYLKQQISTGSSLYVYNCLTICW